MQKGKHIKLMALDCLMITVHPRLLEFLSIYLRYSKTHNTKAQKYNKTIENL